MKLSLTRSVLFIMSFLDLVLKLFCNLVEESEECCWALEPSKDSVTPDFNLRKQSWVGHGEGFGAGCGHPEDREASLGGCYRNPSKG